MLLRVCCVAAAWLLRGLLMRRCEVDRQDKGSNPISAMVFFGNNLPSLSLSLSLYPPFQSHTKLIIYIKLLLLLLVFLFSIWTTISCVTPLGCTPASRMKRRSAWHFPCSPFSIQCARMMLYMSALFTLVCD